MRIQWLLASLVLSQGWMGCGREERVKERLVEIEYKADFTAPYEDNTDLPDYRLVLRTILPRSDKYDRQELFSGDRLAEAYRFRIVEQEYHKTETAQAKVFVQIGGPSSFVADFREPSGTNMEILDAYLNAERANPLDATYGPGKQAPSEAHQATDYRVAKDLSWIGDQSYVKTDFTFSMKNAGTRHVTSYYRMIDAKTILIFRVEWSLAEPEKWWPEATRALWDLFHSVRVEKK